MNARIRIAIMAAAAATALTLAGRNCPSRRPRGQRLRTARAPLRANHEIQRWAQPGMHQGDAGWDGM